MAPKAKRLLFSVTMRDCTLQTFTVPGPGGGGKDTSRTGVRIIHDASGAVGEGSEERSQNANKKKAWDKMGNSKKFRAWADLQAAKIMGQSDILSPEQVMAKVDRDIASCLADGAIIEECF